MRGSASQAFHSGQMIFGTDTAKRLEKCWMDGDLSKHKWMVLLVKFWFPAFQACLSSGHCSLIDAFACICGDQILALRVYIFFGKKRKNTTENHTISDIPQADFGHLPGLKKKPWNHLRKRRSFFPVDSSDETTSGKSGDSDGPKVAPWAFRNVTFSHDLFPNWTRKTWSQKKRPDFWTLCDMYLTSRCWPSVVSFKHGKRGLIFHQLLTWNIWKHPVLCHCQGLHVCSPNQIRHSAWNNLYIRTSNLIT